METISELREQLQKEKLEGRERPWGYRFFQRGPSIYLTKLLIRTPITPNTVTILSILSGLAGATLLLSPVWSIKFLALGFFYLHLLLDRTDGELARYTRIFSLKGIYLDEINHYIIPPLFFVCFAWGIKDITTYPVSIVLLAGTAAGFAALLLRLTHNLPYGIFLKKFMPHQNAFSSAAPAGAGVSDLRKTYAPLYAPLRFFHQFQDFFILLVLFAAVLGAERAAFPNAFLFPYSTLLLFGYAAYLWLIVFENIAKGLLTIDDHMQHLKEKMQKDEHAFSNDPYS